jgi:hypothetical protein
LKPVASSRCASPCCNRRCQARASARRRAWCLNGRCAGRAHRPVVSPLLV